MSLETRVRSTSQAQGAASSGTGGPSSVVYAPTGGPYITFITDPTLTSEKVLTASNNIVLTTDAGAVYISATTGAGGTGLVYASTGNSYILIGAATDLSAERVLTAGAGIAFSDSGANSSIVILADTAVLLTTGRTISTLYPLSGGSLLNINRSFAVDTAFLINTARQVISGVGLSGGGDLSADRTLSVNTNVRDKTMGFFFAGSLSTLMLAQSAMIYIPFNMELRDVRAAVSNSATGANILYNPLQWNAALTATTAMFASANRPFVYTNQLVGSNNGTFAISNLYAGSWLGVNIDQVGSTIPGSNMTVTFVVRTS